MGILDFIKGLFSNGKTHTKLIAEGLTKTKGETDPLEVSLTDKENNPLTDKPVQIEINGVTYTRKTDNDGVARLNINLDVGTYDKVLLTFAGDDEYNRSTAHTTVTVNPILITNDLNMTSGDGSRFTTTLKDINNNNLSGLKVTFTVNGVNYEKETDNNGTAGLNINLQTGTYEVITTVNKTKLTATNTINIAEKAPSINNCFGYWIFGRDMLKVDLQSLHDNGVTDVLLNYYAFTTHGESKVMDWIKTANNLDIRVHIWMQCFYDGEWHNPKTTDLTSKISEAKKYANINGVKGVHLDYLRYPGTAYKTSGGTEAITQFVRNVREAVGDKIFLSCAAMPENKTEYYYGQDIKALGEILDAVIPMQYKGNYNAGTSWLATTTKSFSSKANMWSGLQAYKSDDDTTLLTEDELLSDAKTCLDNGAGGVLLFRYALSNNLNFKKLTGDKVATRMEGTDINMTYKDGTQYQCAVYDNNGRVGGKVNITINGVTYTKDNDSTGLYKLNLNLNPGNYTVTADYLGDNTHLPSSITNSVVINKAPEPTPTPTPEPTKLYPYITEKGGGKLGQSNSVRCGPHSLMQCIYRLTGIELSESTLASVAGTSSSGTSHQGLETALAWFNRKYGYNIKIQWKNFSDLGNNDTERWNKLQEYIDNGASFIHLGYQNGGETYNPSAEVFGHYEVVKTVNSNNLTILNSLGPYCNYPAYCGYIQSRSKSVELAYIQQISQKSVCILTR